MPLIPDIRISVQNQTQLILDPVVKEGQFQRSKNGQLLLYAGGFTAVFPVIINGEKWAFRCWHVPITDASKRLKLVSEFILQKKPSYLVPLEYTQRGIIVKGEIYPTTRMKWIEGKTIKKFLCENLGRKQVLLGIGSSFLSLIENMHDLGIAHGDLQHGNILVADNNNLYLVDYDSMYVPSMGNEYRDEIVGKDDYQHPNRKNNKLSNNKVDYFSELIIYLSTIALAENAQLATKYKLSDTEFLLFSAADFKDIEKSAIYKDLQSLAIPLIDHLLYTLGKYLKVDDINKLQPFNEDSTFKTLLSSYFKSDDDLWDEVKEKNTIESYQDYLQNYPKGVFCTEAKRRVEDLRWNVAISRDTIEAYYTYLNDTDLDLHREEAYEKVEVLSWGRASRLKTEHAYRSYLRTSVPRKHKFEAYIAINELIWNNARETGTIEGFNEYLKKSNTLQQEVMSSVTSTIKRSNSEYLDFVNKINDYQIRANVRLKTLEEELWTKVQNEDTKGGYELYIKQFPSGKHVGECQRRVWTIQFQESEESLWKKARMSHSLSGYRNYLKTSTLKSHQKEAEEKIYQYDDEAWRKARNLDSVADYKKYIDTFPDGKNVRAAQQRIRKLERKSDLSNFFIVIIAIAIISVIMIFSINTFSTSSMPPSKPDSVQAPAEQKIDLHSLEKKIQEQIERMEIAKQNGDLNYDLLKKTEQSLSQIKNSPNYDNYKKKIDELKR